MQQPPRTSGPADSAADAHRVRSVQLHRTHGSARRRKPENDPPWHWALGLVLSMLMLIAIGGWIDELGADAPARADGAATPAPAAPAHGCASQPVHPTTGAT
jgi:hypothetical protein